MKKTFEELKAMKFDVVEHFGMQKKGEFFIMNTVPPMEYGHDCQNYEKAALATGSAEINLADVKKGAWAIKKLLSTIKDEKIIQVTKLGTNWNNGSNSRLFYLNVNNDSGNRNRNISGHLLNAFMMKQGNEQSLLLPVI